MLCNRSAAIDSGATVEITREKVKILGVEIEAEMEWDGGDILTSYFLAAKLAQALGGLRSAEEYTISTKPTSDEVAHFWYVDGIGRHFIMCADPGGFSS
jgi:hypothetical protein